MNKLFINTKIYCLKINIFLNIKEQPYYYLLYLIRLMKWISKDDYIIT